MLCFTEAVGCAPSVRADCGHVFHYGCVAALLEARWAGASVSFGFLQCPLCRDADFSFSSDAVVAAGAAEVGTGYLQAQDGLLVTLGAIRGLRAELHEKALTRAQYEGADRTPDVLDAGGKFHGNLLGYALAHYAYYLCFKCEHPYYGGERACGQAGGHFDPADLVCPACQPHSAELDCPKHGREFLEYKCRFCCSVAVFFCFGTTHFCEQCHNQPGQMQQLQAAQQLPQCPAGPCGRQLEGDCPLGMQHPPSGEECALGCSICRNLRTF
jgi:E3 ubiquitin-protein ligase MYCBP2